MRTKKTAEEVKNRKKTYDKAVYDKAMEKANTESEFRSGVTLERVRQVFEYRDGVLYRKLQSTNQFGKKGDLVETKSSIDKWGHARVGVDRIMLAVHQIVWQLHNGPIPDGLVTDHINGIPDDNRIENLRLVTTRENGQNCKRHREGKPIGGTYNKERKCWHAFITIKDITIYLGSFKSAEEMTKTYYKACSLVNKYENNKQFRKLVKDSPEFSTT